MEMGKAEIEKVEIFLKDLGRKLDLFIEAQAVLGKKVGTKVDGLVTKNVTKEAV